MEWNTASPPAIGDFSISDALPPTGTPLTDTNALSNHFKSNCREDYVRIEQGHDRNNVNSAKADRCGTNQMVSKLYPTSYVMYIIDKDI